MQLNHHEIRVIYHPKNKKEIHLLFNFMKNRLKEIEVFDEYYNHYVVSLISIYYIETTDNKVFVYTKDNVYRINKHIKRLKKELMNFGFFQVNARTLVNAIHITHYKIGEESRRLLTLDNNETLIVNRHYKKELESNVLKENKEHSINNKK